MNSISAFAFFSSPYAGEPRQQSEPQTEFQNAVDAHGGGCPYELVKPVSQTLFDDARLQKDTIATYSNYFGTTSSGVDYSNAFDDATVQITVHSTVCNGGGETPMCQPTT